MPIAKQLVDLLGGEIRVDSGQAMEPLRGQTAADHRRLRFNKNISQRVTSNNSRERRWITGSAAV